MLDSVQICIAVTYHNLVPGATIKNLNDAICNGKVPIFRLFHSYSKNEKEVSCNQTSLHAIYIYRASYRKVFVFLKQAVLPIKTRKTKLNTSKHILQT
jgi:hypothetical protein